MPFAVLAQSSLPPERQTDVVKVKVVEAAKQSDLEGALSGVDEIVAFKVPVAPSLRFLEARTAWQARDAVRALTALDQVLATNDRTGPGYDETVKPYPQYQAAAATAKKESTERRGRQLRIDTGSTTSSWGSPARWRMA